MSHNVFSVTFLFYFILFFLRIKKCAMAFKISSPVYSTFIFRGQVYFTPSDGGLTKLLLEDGEVSSF